jgi:hypothetical protein
MLGEGCNNEMMGTQGEMKKWLRNNGEWQEWWQGMIMRWEACQGMPFLWKKIGDDGGAMNDTKWWQQL